MAEEPAQEPEVAPEIDVDLTSAIAITPTDTVEQKVKASEREAEMMRGVAIARTIPEDWIMQGEFAYLQDKGAQRVAIPWGISFERHEFDDPEVETPGDGGYVTYTVHGAATCLRTNRVEHAIGTKSTAGNFYKRDWDKSFKDGNRPKLIELKMNCKKACLTNLHGNLIRKITGLNSMPPSELEKFGLDISRIKGVQYRGGGGRSEPSRGRPAPRESAPAPRRESGDPGGVTQKQFGMLLHLLDPDGDHAIAIPDDWDLPVVQSRLKALIGDAHLTKEHASLLIDKLTKAVEEGRLVPFDKFVEGLNA